MNKAVTRFLESNDDLYMTLDTNKEGTYIKVVNFYTNMDYPLYIQRYAMWTSGSLGDYIFWTIGMSKEERQQILEPIIGPLPIDASKVYKLSREDKDGILLAVKMVNL